MTQNCPCGRSRSFELCCQKIHIDISKAITAEDLMRSRYTAFTIGNGDYLMKSHHPLTRRPDQKDSIVKWANSVDWIRLEIIDVNRGGAFDYEGTVEFKAHFKEKGKIQFLHEKSVFKKEYGTWLYYE